MLATKLESKKSFVLNVVASSDNVISDASINKDRFYLVIRYLSWVKNPGLEPVGMFLLLPEFCSI